MPSCLPERSRKRAGFTLLEVLVSLMILALAFTVIYSTFSATTDAWRRGTDAMEQLHHGEFVMEQLATALRSAAWFDTTPEKYTFRMADEGGKFPTDLMSWVTASPAFIPPASYLSRSVHRIDINVEEGPDGEPAVAVRAYPHLVDEEDMSKLNIETWFVSSVVKGINCQVFVEENSGEDGEWMDEWESSNSVPRLVHVTLFMDPLEDEKEPRTLERMIEVPVARPIVGEVEPPPEVGR